MAAKDDLLFVAKRFRAVIDLIPVLEEMDTVEASINEKRVQLEELMLEHAFKMTNLQAIEDDIEDARDRHNALVANNDAEAEEKMKMLRSEMELMREKSIAHLTKDTATLRKQYDTTVRNIQKKKGQLDAIVIELEEKTSRLEKTKDALEKLKNQL